MQIQWEALQPRYVAHPLLPLQIGQWSMYIFEPTSYTVLYENWQNYFMLWLAECRAYGEDGMDIGQCSSMGGSIACADCDRFFNVKRDMCPVMCGLCDRKYTHIYVIHNCNQENFFNMNQFTIMVFFSHSSLQRQKMWKWRKTECRHVYLQMRAPVHRRQVPAR